MALAKAVAGDTPAGVPVADDRALAFMQECGVTVEMDAEALRRLVGQLECAIESAERAVATVREQCGSNPASLPGQLVTVMQMGAGYFRTARDTIRALFTARNARRRAAKKRDRDRA